MDDLTVEKKDATAPGAENNYKLLKIIGKGTYSTVYLTSAPDKPKAPTVKELLE